jgi:hypothetical protein
MKFVGWDWASTSHDVTVLDDQAKVVERWALRHTEQALGQALARLARHGQPAELPVIIERSTGLVVDRLLAAGHPVVPVHPTAFHAARPRWGAAGAKPIRVTATSWLTTSAPTGTGCAGYNRSTQACGSCRPWSGDARTMSATALLPATSSARCWTPPGPDQGHVLQAGQRYRPGLPGRLSDPAVSNAARRSPPGWVLPPPRLPRRQATSRPPGPAAGSADPTNRAGPCCARPAGHRAGPAAAHPADHHRRAGNRDQAAGRPAPTRQAPERAPRRRHHQPGPATGRSRSDP